MTSSMGYRKITTVNYANQKLLSLWAMLLALVFVFTSLGVAAAETTKTVGDLSITLDTSLDQKIRVTPVPVGNVDAGKVKPGSEFEYRLGLAYQKTEGLIENQAIKVTLPKEVQFKGPDALDRLKLKSNVTDASGVTTLIFDVDKGANFSSTVPLTLQYPVRPDGAYQPGVITAEAVQFNGSTYEPLSEVLAESVTLSPDIQENQNIVMEHTLTNPKTGNASVGMIVSYKIKVGREAGATLPLYNVALKDMIPAGGKVIGMKATKGGVAFPADSFTGDLNRTDTTTPQDLVWNIDTLAPGEIFEAELDIVYPEAKNQSTFECKAEASGTRKLDPASTKVVAQKPVSVKFDETPLQNEVKKSTRIQGTGVDRYSNGQTAKYTIDSYRNNYSWAVKNLDVLDVFPEGFTLTKAQIGVPGADPQGKLYYTLTDLGDGYGKNGSAIDANTVYPSYQSSNKGWVEITPTELASGAKEYNFSELPGVKAIRWSFTDVPPAWRMPTLQLEGPITGSEGAKKTNVAYPLETFEGTGGGTGGGGGFRPIKSSSASLQIVPALPVVKIAKAVDKPIAAAGTDLVYTVTVTNDAWAPGDLDLTGVDTFQLIDTLPTYKDRSGPAEKDVLTDIAYQIDSASIAAAQVSLLTEASTNTKKVWKLKGFKLQPGQSFSFAYTAKLASNVWSNDYTNTINLDYNSFLKKNMDLDNAKGVGQAKATVQVPFSGTLSTTKGVAVGPEISGAKYSDGTDVDTSTATTATSDGKTYLLPGKDNRRVSNTAVENGKIHYRVNVKTAELTGPLSKVVVIDKLPAVNDWRGSAWTPQLVSNITLAGQGLDQNNLDVYYSKLAAPSYAALLEPKTVTDQTAGGWIKLDNSKPPAETTSITHLKFVINNSFYPGESAEATVSWTMQVPPNAPKSAEGKDDIAWNHVQFSAAHALGKLSASGSAQVGVRLDKAATVGKASVHGRIWEDANLDGLLNTKNESGKNDVIVRLYKVTDLSKITSIPASSALAGTYRTVDQHGKTGTEKSGYFDFLGLDAGNYVLAYEMPKQAADPNNANLEIPATWLATPQVTKEGTKSDFAVAGKAEGDITLQFGKPFALGEEESKLFNGGIYRPSTVNGQLFEDADANGIKNSTEATDVARVTPGDTTSASIFAGLTVRLIPLGEQAQAGLKKYDAGVNDSAKDSGMKAVTYHDGTSENNNLEGAGQPYLETTLTELGKYNFGPQAPGKWKLKFVLSPSLKGNLQFYNAQSTLSDFTKHTSIAKLDSLAKEVQLVSGKAYPSVDAGFYGAGSYSGIFWFDADMDGMASDAEKNNADQTDKHLSEFLNAINPARSGAKQALTLHKWDGSKFVLTETVPNKAKGTTPNDLFYTHSASGLLPGKYQLQLGALNKDQKFGLHAPGPGLHNKATTIGDTFFNPDPATGHTASIEFVVKSRENTNGADGGFFIDYSIDGFVWIDSNGNGRRDAGEPGFKDALPVTATGIEPVTAPRKVNTSTGADPGTFVFNRLDLGNYDISLPLPAGYVLSPRLVEDYKQATDDNDALLVSGQVQIAAVGAQKGGTRVGIGVYQLGKISGFAWFDEDKNGIRAVADPEHPDTVAEDKPVPGTIVTLYKGKETVGTVTVGDDGKYEFTDLAPGSYTIKVEAPADYWISNLRSRIPGKVVKTAGLPVALTSGEHQVIDTGLHQQAPATDPAPGTYPDTPPPIVKPPQGLDGEKIYTPPPGTDSVIVINPPAKGTVVITDDMKVIYTPFPGSTGRDSVTIRVTENGVPRDIVLDVGHEPLQAPLNPENVPGAPGTNPGTTDPTLPATGATPPTELLGASSLLVGLGLLLLARHRRWVNA